MTNSKSSKGPAIRSTRYGLLVTLTSVAIAGLIALGLGLIKQDQANAVVSDLGNSHAQLLASVATQSPEQATLQLSNKPTQIASKLLYMAITDEVGQVQHSYMSANVQLPSFPHNQQPNQSYEARHVQLASSLIANEFSAPIMRDKQRAGTIYIAYKKTSFIEAVADVYVIAIATIPIVLLALLLKLIKRQEVRPLLRTHAALLDQQASNDSDIAVSPNDSSLGAIAGELSTFIETANNKIHTLECDNDNILASSKVLEYRFSRLTSMVESLPQGVMIFDHSGSIVFANARASSLLGTSSEILVEKEITHWCTKRELLQFMSKCANPANLAISQLRTEITANNRDYHLSFDAIPLFADSENRTSSGNLVLINDCRQQIDAEASREEFVAHISHELKTPLNTLVVYSEALLGPDGTNEQFRAEGLNVIYDEAERMVGLINNLLSITKIEMGSMEIDRQRVKLSEFLSDTFSKIEKASLDKGLNFQINTPNDSIPAAIDKELMRIAINNLLTNAVKYSNAGDTVTLELEDLDDLVRITVSDTGIGISEQDIEHIFDKFFRSESNDVRDRSGHGLGLSLAHDIVKLHNGQMNVSSEIGQGTQFTIDINKENALLRNIA